MAMDIVERLRNDAKSWAGATHTVAGPNVATLERDAAAEIERLRAFIQSLDGKMVCIPCDGDTVIDDGIIVSSDILSPDARDQQK